jgi:hypothetical protein
MKNSAFKIVFYSVCLALTLLIYSSYSTFEMKCSYEYHTSEIDAVYPFRGTIETSDGQTINTEGGGGVFWFNDDPSYKNFYFEVVEMENIYGFKTLITKH